MRVFIAVDFDNEIKNHIKNIQNQIIPYSLQGNFSRVDNFHITLKFIGEVQKDMLQPIFETVDNTASQFNTFSLSINQLGYFNKQNKKILWVGINDSNNLLESLSHKINNDLSLCGFEKEIKKYRPHITLARQVILQENFDTIKKNIGIINKNIEVNKISVMESKREKGLLIYNPIYVKSLKNIMKQCSTKKCIT